MAQQKKKVYIWYIILLIGIAIAIFFLKPLSSRLILNYAQVSRMHGTIKPELYTQALTLTPKDIHLRCQTGKMFFQIRDFDEAATILLPITKNIPINEKCTRLTLAILSMTHHEQEALDFYRSLNPQPNLVPGTAARILIGLLNSDTPVQTETVTLLLSRTFGLDHTSPEFATLGQLIAKTDFWTTPLGTKTKNALEWKTDFITNTDHIVSIPEPNQVLVASLLKVSSEEISFGDELILNGSFETYNIVYDTFPGWVPSRATSNPYHLAAFVVGQTDTSAKMKLNSMRIDGLYREDPPTYINTRAGYVYWKLIFLNPNIPYIISFIYRSEGVVKDTTAVLLGYTKNVFWTSDKRFPPTNGTWKRVTIIGWNRTDKKATIRPLLRSWGLGSVWFDDFSIREIILPPGVDVEPQEPIVHIEDAEK